MKFYSATEKKFILAGLTLALMAIFLIKWKYPFDLEPVACLGLFYLVSFLGLLLFYSKSKIDNWIEPDEAC